MSILNRYFDLTTPSVSLTGIYLDTAKAFGSKKTFTFRCNVVPFPVEKMNNYRTSSFAVRLIISITFFDKDMKEDLELKDPRVINPMEQLMSAKLRGYFILHL